ncbi:hypothetical protein [Anaerotignum sp.]|uniref:hypothetical protein n=1 Tax=Anaerotignum sp. TaxID=2039241 RepID=UPI0028A936A0|nr:hypothetical protein [Anaerotignum sp.]
MEKKTWEEAMKVARAMCEGQDVSEEQVENFAKKIMSYSEKENVEVAVNADKSVIGEIARCEVNQNEEVIGSGIVLESVAETSVTVEEEDFIIRFKEPYFFEGKTYTGVDLWGLTNLRAKDIWKVNRNYRNAGNISLLQEMDSEYTARVAARASGMPVEFFEGMSLQDMIKVRTKVSDFFYPRE